MPRLMNPRLCMDTVRVHETFFEDDDEGSPEVIDEVDDNEEGTEVTGVCVQPQSLTDRPVRQEGDVVETGTSRANILFRLAPPAGIGTQTLIRHTKRYDPTTRASVDIVPSIKYRAQGEPVPPSGGMTAWTVSVEVVA